MPVVQQPLARKKKMPFLLPLLVLFAPAFAGEAPFSEFTKVYVAVSTNKIGAIREVEGQFGFDFYFYITW